MSTTPQRDLQSLCDRLAEVFNADDDTPCELCTEAREAIEELWEERDRLRKQPPADRAQQDRGDIVRMAAAAGFTKDQWRAMFYETGPYDITEPTVEMQNLVRLIHEARPAPEPRDDWRPMDTAPKGTPVLLCNQKWQQPVVLGYFDSGYNSWTGMGVGLLGDPQGWLPVPSFPTTKDGGL